MSSISGVNGVNYGAFASGIKLQSASDGAAEMAITEKEDSQIKGYEAGANNIGSAKDAINISDAALGSITDYLQRIRELALSSMNATVSDSDKQSIQSEIDQMKSGIADVASQTQYNTKNLLDGSNNSFQIATDPNGGSSTVSTVNATLESLGIADFDVTGDFDLSKIDDAIAKISDGRSTMGAQSNGLEYLERLNSTAAYNHTAAKSKLEDLDYPQAIEEKKKQEVLQQYAIMMQKKKQEEEQQKLNLFQ